MILAALQKTQQLPFSDQQLALANLAGVVLLLVGLSVYARLFRRVGENGGCVRTDHFDLTDLFITISLVIILALLAASALHALATGAGGAAPPKKPITADGILSGSLFLFIPAAGICAFLTTRRISLQHTFGLRRVPLGKALIIATGLVLAIFPALALTNVLMIKILGAQADPQELVKIYKGAVAEKRFDIIGAIIFTGTVMAPLCEEFLFRGYFYPVLKRLVGPMPSAVFVSVLFGAVHSNLLTLPSLVLLALALTLAYEWSGSLLVPIFMHSVFNGTSLLLVWAMSRYGIDV